MTMIEPGQLRQWEQELNAQIEALRQRYSEVESELQRSVRKLELVRQMLAVDEKGIEPQQICAVDSSILRPTAVTVRDSVRKVLEDAGKPLHISEIHQEFLRRGYPIPGGGTPFNILAHIVKNRAFVRLARGTYALSENVPADQILVARDGKRKRRCSKRQEPPVSCTVKQRLSA